MRQGNYTIGSKLADQNGEFSCFNTEATAEKSEIAFKPSDDDESAASEYFNSWEDPKIIIEKLDRRQEETKRKILRGQHLKEKRELI